MAGMSQLERLVTWGLLLLLLVLRRLSQNLELAREEIEEFGQYTMGEKLDSPD